MLRRTFLLAGAAPCLLPVHCVHAANSSLGTIAFVQGGDLWVRPLPDGRPRRLTSGIPIQSPRFSPSGQWIACRSEQAVHVLRTDGSTQRQLPSGSVTWVPARDVLVLSNRDGVRLLNTNGWVSSTIVNEEADLPVFSPDGTQFAYASALTNGRGTGGEPLRTGQIRRVAFTVPEYKPQTLVSKYLTGFSPCIWTSDAKSVLYWEDPDFSASLMADGLELLRISASGGPAERLGVTTLVHDNILSLSPTQNSLAVTVGAGRESWSGKRIAIVDLDKSTLRYLTDENTSALCPSWSPDGTQIAYSAGPDAVVEYLKHMNNPSTIKVLGLDGRPRTTAVNPRTISVGGEEARPYLEQRKIWTAVASGGNMPKQLTSDDGYRDEEPLWSASGTHILFCRMDRASNGTLWIMTAAGENPIQVSDWLTLDRNWFGYYGYIDWRRSFDWFRPSS
jgi:Tol biopolymer transport system component